MLCIIVTLSQPFCYNKVLIGVKISPGYAQARMEEVLRGMESVEVYIDDIAIFSNSWNSHIVVLKEVLKRLEDNGITVNPLKCVTMPVNVNWAQQLCKTTNP